MKPTIIVIISILLHSCSSHKYLVNDYANPRFCYKGGEEEIFSVEEVRGKDNLLSLYVSDNTINCVSRFEGYVRCKAKIELDSIGNVRKVFISEQIPNDKEIEDCITKTLYMATFVPAKEKGRPISKAFSILLFIDLYNLSY